MRLVTLLVVIRNPQLHLPRAPIRGRLKTVEIIVKGHALYTLNSMVELKNAVVHSIKK